ncbi:MAG: hypothetical protein IJ341_12960 [Bacteroidales bacterium]|nr:hypothetical protein [Bacteroidales bacterium]
MNVASSNLASAIFLRWSTPQNLLGVLEELIERGCIVYHSLVT